jgi:hypothetical protein
MDGRIKRLHVEKVKEPEVEKVEEPKKMKVKEPTKLGLTGTQEILNYRARTE